MTNPPGQPLHSEIIPYQTGDGKTRIDVRVEGETVWLTQKIMAEMCRAAGIAPPEFAEISGAAVVVYRMDVLGSAGAYPQVAHKSPYTSPPFCTHIVA
jgi:hypothetical protein